MTFEQQIQFRSAVVLGYSALIDEVRESGDDYEHLLGIPEAGSSIAAMVGYHRGDSVLYRRVNYKKDHGIDEPINGDYLPGDRVIEIDDLVSSFGAKEDERKLLAELTATRNKDGEVVAPPLEAKHVVCLIDRSGGKGQAAAEAAGMVLHTVLTADEVFDISHQAGAMPTSLYDLANAYFAGTVTSPEARDEFLRQY